MTGGLFDKEEAGGQVDAIPFEALEAKVNLVLERLRASQSEKADLQKQVEVWRERYEEAASKIEGLTSECDALRRNQRDPEQEELIRSKIAALLARLEEA